MSSTKNQAFLAQESTLTTNSNRVPKTTKRMQSSSRQEQKRPIGKSIFFRQQQEESDSDCGSRNSRQHSSETSSPDHNLSQAGDSSPLKIKNEQGEKPQDDASPTGWSMTRSALCAVFMPPLHSNLWLKLRQLSLNDKHRENGSQQRPSNYLHQFAAINLRGTARAQAPPIKAESANVSTQKQNGPSSENLTGSAGPILLLDLLQFKTQPCTLKTNHSFKKCMYHHDAKQKDRRRLPTGYSSEMCTNLGRGRKECPLGDACTRAHNRVEDFYHPERYKSKFCSSYPDAVAKCEYGDACAFAHSEQELSINLLDKMERDVDFYLFHFKTVWCPNSDKEHQRDLCVYAHNWQDFRRAPQTFMYEGKQCSGWETKKNTKTYKDGCKLEYRCGSCHGWKELEYHPLQYKTQECRTLAQGQCKKSHCPYYHCESEKRTVDLSQYYHLQPRNRGFVQSQVTQYQPHYLKVMFQNDSRSQQAKQDPTHEFYYAEQSLYGCGPLSIPVVDPRLVLEYQRARMPPSYFERALQSSSTATSGDFEAVVAKVKSVPEMDQISVSSSKSHQVLSHSFQPNVRATQRQPLKQKNTMQELFLKQIQQKDQHQFNRPSSIHSQQMSPTMQQQHQSQALQPPVRYGSFDSNCLSDIGSPAMSQPKSSQFKSQHYNNQQQSHFAAWQQPSKQLFYNQQSADDSDSQEKQFDFRQFERQVQKCNYNRLEQSHRSNQGVVFGQQEHQSLHYDSMSSQSCSSNLSTGQLYKDSPQYQTWKPHKATTAQKPSHIQNLRTQSNKMSQEIGKSESIWGSNYLENGLSPIDGYHSNSDYYDSVDNHQMKDTRQQTYFVPDYRGGADGELAFNETQSMSQCSMGDDLQDIEEFTDTHEHIYRTSGQPQKLTQFLSHHNLHVLIPYFSNKVDSVAELAGMSDAHIEQLCLGDSRKGGNHQLRMQNQANCNYLIYLVRNHSTA